jgi:hypothetical protein
MTPPPAVVSRKPAVGGRGQGRAAAVAFLPALCPAGAREGVAGHAVLPAGVRVKEGKQWLKKGRGEGKRGIF